MTAANKNAKESISLIKSGNTYRLPMFKVFE